MKLLTQRGIKMKKTIIYYLVTAALILSLSSCGEKADDSSSEAEKTETKASVTSEAETASEAEPEYKGEFNEQIFDEMCQNCSIRGKNVSFPFSLNDLGDEYRYENFFEIESQDLEYYDLFKDDDNLMNVAVRTDDGDLRDYKMISLLIRKPQYDIKIDGIAVGDNIKKVFQKYGEKDETPTNQDYYKRYDYKITDKKYMYFLATSDGTIDEIEIWWR